MNTQSKSTPTRVTDMPEEEARRFFLKEESYRGFDLPPYFRFSDILLDVSQCLDGKHLSDFIGSLKPSDCECVNYRLLANKDGKYAWRPLELIHPALYVSLINEITNPANWSTITRRFHSFHEIENIYCMSIPLEATEGLKDRESQILNWWSEIEQRSIELSLEYETIIHADITDCYGQIYTHSISWSIHDKEFAKRNRRDKHLIGNIIDRHIQDMRHGQTNGIPQGSVLMDFIAEMVLGYGDDILSKKIEALNVNDFKILRYRDDYRIFVHSTYDGEKILKALTETLIELGFKLNSSKTVISQNVITSSIKKDKIDWIRQNQSNKDLQKHLLVIHDHSMKHPNTGSLLKGLSGFRERLEKMNKCSSATTLISIIVDIAYHNPRTYPICAAILSRLLMFVEDKHQKKTLLKKVVTKFSRLPNTEYMAIWLQRIALPIGLDIDFNSTLCDLCRKKAVNVWNCEWIESDDLKRVVRRNVFDKKTADELDAIIPAQEVELFLKDHSL